MGFKECCKHVHVVTLKRDKWASLLFKKLSLLSHIFSGVNERLLAIPLEFKNAKIGQKPRLGRKPKAKKGDALKKLRNENYN